jgi:uncharacterized protein (TIGR03118 family)
MKFISKAASTVLALTATFLPAAAHTTGPNVYVQTNLVANTKSFGAAVVDPNLVDPWGISLSTSSPFWISNRLSGTSTLYNGAGTANATVVKIPAGAASAAGSLGQPTGQVQNNLSTATPVPFLLPAPDGKTASFIFDTDDGTISAWNGSVTASTAVVTVDNSASGAIYKGLAIGTSAGGPTLYAANFHSGKVEAYNSVWAPATLAGTFTDPAVPSGFAPFNIWNIGGKLYVSYAKQNATQTLDVAGAGNGYVSVFDLNGNLLTHLISGGALNSPWGMAIAPASWGAFGGALLVGNFGDGTINAFNATTGAQLGTLWNASGAPIVNSGLWALVFGNGKSGGDTNTLYFTAGVPDGTSVQRGLLGSIAPPAAITSIVNAASIVSGNVAPGEIVLITGQTVGPSPSVTSTIPAPGSKLPTVVNSTIPVNTTTITFNGTAAPVVYAGSGATAVQVPYEIAGSTSASVLMTVGSQTAAPFTVPVAPTSPGLFTINYTGTGQVVALNADGTVNSAANPAARGSSIMLFATGEGVTAPADTDGIGEANATLVPTAPITVTFDGISATVASDTSFPKDVSGVLDITVTVPTNIAPGLANVLLTAGGVSTPTVTATTQGTVLYVK